MTLLREFRVNEKITIVIGGGQRKGETIGNGRASAITYAKEGAKVIVVDNNLEAAQDTVDEINSIGGFGLAYKADVTKELEIEKMILETQKNFGRIDILHNNVGISIAGGDSEITQIDSKNFDYILSVNLKSIWQPIIGCKPLSLKRTENSNALNKLLVSVSAMAGISLALQSSGSFFKRVAPSSREYSVCTRR